MMTLPELLERWAAIAPDECDEVNDRVYFIGALASKVFADSLDLESEVALILGAIIYHSARRGLDTRTSIQHRHGARSVQVQAESREWLHPTYSRSLVDAGEPNERATLVMREVAINCLSAYLDAIS